LPDLGLKTGHIDDWKNNLAIRAVIGLPGSADTGQNLAPINKPDSALGGAKYTNKAQQQNQKRGNQPAPALILIS
jgi:hypothetical protein